MKQLLIKVCILLVTMSILSASKEDTGSTKSTPCASDNTRTCLQKGNDYALNIPNNKSKVVAVKKIEVAVRTVADDHEISLSPISRFILLQ